MTLSSTTLVCSATVSPRTAPVVASIGPQPLTKMKSPARMPLRVGAERRAGLGRLDQLLGHAAPPFSCDLRRSGLSRARSEAASRSWSASRSSTMSWPTAMKRKPWRASSPRRPRRRWRCRRRLPLRVAGLRRPRRAPRGSAGGRTRPAMPIEAVRSKWPIQSTSTPATAAIASRSSSRADGLDHRDDHQLVVGPPHVARDVTLVLVDVEDPEAALARPAGTSPRRRPRAPPRRRGSCGTITPSAPSASATADRVRVERAARGRAARSRRRGPAASSGRI